MKALFAALMLVTCATAQANANSKATESDPSWLKDMQVLNCRYGACVNETTKEVDYDAGVQDGYTVVFPNSYDEEKLREISPAVIRWIKVNGIPAQ